MNYQDFISEINTTRFGFPIAVINNFNEKPEKIIDGLKSHNVALVISKIDAQNITLINELENIGFKLKDIQLTYKLPMSAFDLSNFDIDSEIILREASDKDIEVLTKIAGNSFSEYGHYAADEKLDKSKCKEIYADWIHRTLTEKGIADIIIVAEADKQVAGFLSFKINKHLNYAAGGLGAVSTNFRNRNIFKHINIAGLEWGRKTGLEWIEHNVLSTNIPVNRVYNSLGFSLKNSFITMHCWL